MSSYITLYNYSLIILLLPLAALSFFAIKYVRNGWSRLTVSVLFVVALTVGFVIPNEFTSYPKPTTQEWMDRNLPEAQVLWAHIDPVAEIMYLLLARKDQPRLYHPKWDWDIAKELATAMMESEAAKEQGGDGEITMAYPFLDKAEREERMREDGRAEEEPREEFRQGGQEQEDDSNIFHVAPPPTMPEKAAPKPQLRT
jgi:hypothetical protein